MTEPFAIEGEVVEPKPLHGEDLEREKARLTEVVLREIGSPIDSWAVAAALEVEGLRDFDAATRFGAWDLFDLADEIYARCRTRLEGAPAGQKEGASAPPTAGRIGRFLRFYLYGAFFIVPLGIQLGSLLLFGYSQWASVHFSERQASIVVVAVIGGFVLTAGFVQGLGYLGPLFIEPGEYVLAQRLVTRLLGLGVLFTAAGGAVWWLVNLAVSAYSERDIGISLVYYLLVSGVSLASAALYMLRKFLAMVVSTIGGIGVVALIVNETNWSIYAAHWISLGVSILIALGWVAAVLKVRARRAGNVRAAARMPRAPLLAYLVAPYFVYGLLYFGLLFADRVVGWSTGNNPLPIWFRPAYEVGLDWALVSLVLGIAVLEYTVNAFSSRIVRVQERFSGDRIDDHNRYFVRFYLTQLAAVVALAGAGIALSYEGALWLRHYHALHEIRGFFTNSATRGVFVAGVVGYTLLAWGLLNGLFLFSLSRPKLVLRAAAPALLVSIAVGIPLSRTYDYWYSVVGLAAGALVYALVSTWYALRVLSRTDFYYYSAY
jgi:hypothetical protein